MTKIARSLEISMSFIFSWLKDDPKFADNYARAREIGDDAEFERIIDEAAVEPPRVKGWADTAWVSWQRNLTDVRKWSLAKRRPKKYGDKLDLNMGGSLNVTNLTEEELAARLSGFGITNAPPKG